MHVCIHLYIYVHICVGSNVTYTYPYVYVYIYGYIYNHIRDHRFLLTYPRNEYNEKHKLVVYMRFVGYACRAKERPLFGGSQQQTLLFWVQQAMVQAGRPQCICIEREREMYGWPMPSLYMYSNTRTHKHIH